MVRPPTVQMNATPRLTWSKIDAATLSCVRPRPLPGISAIIGLRRPGPLKQGPALSHPCRGRGLPAADSNRQPDL